MDDKDSSHYDSGGDKKGGNLVVDVFNEDPSSLRANPTHSPREMGLTNTICGKKMPSAAKGPRLPGEVTLL